MTPKTKFYLLVTFILSCCFSIIAFSCKAQCGAPVTANCQGVPFSELIQSTSGNVDFTFDDFSKYRSGITQSGTTMLRLKVLPNNASCKWALRVYIENNPGAGTPVNEWESLSSYGSGTTPPTLDLLAFKVYNGCGTPINNSVYQNFSPVNGSYIDIVNDATLIPAGSCTSNVNGAGTYLSNPNEYSFMIDYRIVPGLNFTPGVYQLVLHFCLVEQP